jgi:hypothetical protein
VYFGTLGTQWTTVSVESVVVEDDSSAVVSGTTFSVVSAVDADGNNKLPNTIGRYTQVALDSVVLPVASYTPVTVWINENGMYKILQILTSRGKSQFYIFDDTNLIAAMSTATNKADASPVDYTGQWSSNSDGLTFQFAA